MINKLIKIVVFAVTGIVTVLFAISYIKVNFLKDKTIPVITVPDGVFEVSVNARDEDILEGVTAYDKKDGDITDDLIIESISKFSSDGTCKVSIAVCDADNHVSTAIRTILYNDYTSPKFTMTRSLVFSIYDKFDMVGIIGAEDCLDGDISQNVIIYSPDFEEDTEGEFSVEASVMNSKGESVTITLPIIVEKQAKNGPEIVLNKYILYMSKDSATVPDWTKFIKETVDAEGVDAKFDVEIETDYEPGVTGVYSVDYYIYNEPEEESTAETTATAQEKTILCHTAMIVVVE